MTAKQAKEMAEGANAARAAKNKADLEASEEAVRNYITENKLNEIIEDAASHGRISARVSMDALLRIPGVTTAVECHFVSKLIGGILEPKGFQVFDGQDGKSWTICWSNIIDDPV